MGHLWTHSLTICKSMMEGEDLIVKFSPNRMCLTHWGRDEINAIFADDIFRCILLNENVFSIKISLKFIPKRSINNNFPALVQIMAWRRPGDKPLSEPMIVKLMTHICGTRTQWVNKRPMYPMLEQLHIDDNDVVQYTIKLIHHNHIVFYHSHTRVCTIDTKLRLEE